MDRTLRVMTDHLPDSRAIEPTAEKYNATLVKREDDNDSLARFWVRTDGPMPDFAPGQYMTIGVYADEGATDGDRERHQARGGRRGEHQRLAEGTTKQMTVMKAPWTKEEVELLMKYQSDPRFHPYTCAIHSSITLSPTPTGWVCGVTSCRYKQDWAHKEDLKWLMTEST